MEICNSCAIFMTAPEVACGGFCNASFHFKCAQISEERYKEIVGNSATFWMCRGCREIMGNARFKNTLKSMNEATKEVNNVYQKLVDDLRTEIKDSLIAELRQEIQGGFDKLSPAIFSPAPNRFQFNRRAKRNREQEETTQALSDPPSKVLRGTNLAINQSTSGSVGLPERQDSKFWIYLTKISPEATEDDIVQLAKNCLQVEDVVAKVLIPRGRSLSTMTFISFKVGICADLKLKAMDPCTWPPEIEFREFIETTPTIRHFWKPGQSADPGSSNAMDTLPASVPSLNLVQQ